MSLLLLAPHPDDETIAAGLLLQEAQAHGAAMRVVFLTDGERNPIPQFLIERHWPWRSVDRTRWGSRRRDEARAALRTLGLAAECAEFWALPDQGVRRGASAAIERLQRTIVAFQPTLLVSPSLHDLHPDHQAAALIAGRALLKSRIAAEHLVYRVHGAMPRGVPLWQPPSSPERAFRKAAAMECHHSQMTASRKRLTELARRPEVFARWEDEAPMPAASFRPLRRAAHVVRW